MSSSLCRPALLHAALPLLLVLAPAACDDSTPTDVGDEPPGEAILFVRGDAEGDIFRMAPDGTGVANLTNHPARYSGLRLSPDGARVVFYSDRAGCYDVWVMDVDGSDLRQLTGVEAFERCNYNPEWSPDGTLISFYSSRSAADGTGWDAYVIRPDGTGLVELAPNPSTELETSTDMTDGWSPDGRVVLYSDRDGTERTWLASPDGTGLESFADGYVYPAWSPDGSRVLCQLPGPGDGDAEVVVMDADGSGETNLSEHAAWDAIAARGASPWSPDGSRVLFVSVRSGSLDVWSVAPDGSGLRNLTAHPARDDFRAWSPDGTRFLFVSDRSGSRDLWVADATGLDARRLTDHPADENEALWVPAR